MGRISKSAAEISVVTKMYDFTLWLLPHTAQFSHAHRFTLGAKVENAALETLEMLIEASYTHDKKELLLQANRRLERLRYLLRLSKDLKLVNIKQYEFAARALVEVGSEVGGWVKSLK